MFDDIANPLTALIYNNIGGVHNFESRSDEAPAYAMKCLTIREQRLPAGAQRWETPITMSATVNYYGVDRIAESQEYHEKAVQVHEKASTLSDDLLQGAYSCIGGCHLHQGNLEEAEKWLDKAISHLKIFKSPNHLSP